MSETRYKLTLVEVVSDGNDKRTRDIFSADVPDPGNVSIDGLVRKLAGLLWGERQP